MRPLFLWLYLLSLPAAAAGIMPKGFLTKDGYIYFVLQSDKKPTYRSFELEGPERFVVDIGDAVLQEVRRRFEGMGKIRQVRVAQFNKSVVRVVAEVEEKGLGDILWQEKEGLLLIKLAQSDSRKRAVDFILVRRTNGEIDVKITGTNLRFSLSEEEKKILVTIPDAKLNFPYREVLVEQDLLDRIEVAEAGKDVLITIYSRLAAQVQPSLSDDGTTLLLRIGAKEGAPSPPEPSGLTTQIRAVRVERKPEAIEIVVEADKALAFTSEALSFPDRLNVLFTGAALLEATNLEVNEPPVSSVRTLFLEPEKASQLRIGLTKPVEPEVKMEAGNARIIFSFPREKVAPTVPESAVPVAEPLVETPAEPASSPSTPEKVVTPPAKPQENGKEPAGESPQTEPVVERVRSPVAGSIKEIKTETTDTQIRVVVESDQALVFQSETLSFPDRFNLNISEAALAEAVHLEVNAAPVKTVRALYLDAEKTTQVSIALTRQTEPDVQIEEGGKRLVVAFTKEKEAPAPVAETPKETPAQPEGAQPSPTTPAKTETPPTPEPTLQVAKISSVTARKADGRVMLQISADQLLAYKSSAITGPPHKILVELFQAELGFGKRTLDINHGSVLRARVYQHATEPVPIARIVVDVAQPVDFEIFPRLEGQQIQVSIAAPPKPAPVAAAKKVEPAKKPAPKKEAQTPKTPSKTQAKQAPTSPYVPLPSPLKVHPRAKVVNMEFKDAAVDDILRILSDMAGINLFIADDATSISRRLITIRLYGISIEKALDMVVNTAGLAHRIFDNTLLVAKDWDTVNRVGSSSLSGDYLIETFSIRGYTKEELKAVLERVVPEAIVVEDAAGTRPKDTITVLGSLNTLNRIRRIIESSPQPPMVRVETFDLVDLNPTSVEEALKSAIPEATIISTQKSPNLITVSGTPYTLARVKRFLGELNLQPVTTYKTFEVRETPPEDIERLLRIVLPGVQMVRALIGTDTTSVTLSGTQEDLDQAEKLIQSIEGGENRRNMAKSVAVVPLKHLDTIKALMEQEDQDLQKIIEAYVPGLQDSGGTITLDTRTNSVIVRATPTDVEKIKAALASLDAKLPQVLIEAQVLDMTQDAFREFSAKAGFQAESPGEDVRDTHPPSFSTAIGSGGGEVGFSFNMLRAKFDVTIANFVREGKATVLASPRLLTVSGKKARIDLVDEFPTFAEKAVDTQVGTSTVTRVVREPSGTQTVGIVLELTPRVNADNQITINIKPEVSVPLGDPDPSTGQVPINKRTVETLMRLQDGGSVVIGGLVNSVESERVSKLPFLSELPIVGKLFKSSRKEKTDREVVIIITAQIIKDETEEAAAE